MAAHSAELEEGFWTELWPYIGEPDQIRTFQ